MKRPSSLQQLIVTWAAPYLVVAAPTLTLCPRPAVAQSERESESRAEPTTSEPLKLYVALSSPALDAERVRREVAGELRRQVVLATNDEATLTITDSTAGAASPAPAQSLRAPQLQFRYVTREGRVLTRALDLPRDPKKALQLIALLSGNLARDQTSDLIGALHDQRTAALNANAAVEAESARTDATPASPETRADGSQAPPEPAPAPTEKSHGETAQKAEGPSAKARVAAPVEPKPDTPRSYAPLNLSLWHPLSLNPKSHEQGYRFELGLAYSRIGALEGAAFSTGVLRVDGPLTGAAFATLWLSSGGPLHGSATSGIFAQNRGDSEGAQFSGVVAQHGEGGFTGAQVAGAVSLAGDLTGLQASGAYSQSQRFRGAQLAGAATHAREASHGFVAAGAVTWTRSLQGAAFAGALSVSEDVDGLVAAGAATVARDVQGLAIAGGVNVQRDVTGLAVASVNVQRHVRGLQIGVVNVAERVDGAAIGLINLAGNGRVSALGWVDQDAAYGGVRFISGLSYTELAFGHELSSKRYVTDAGLGLHLPVGQRITVSVGGAFSETRTRWDEDQDHAEAIGRGSVGLRLTPMLELFAGAGLRYGVLGDTKEEFRPEGRLGLAIF